MSDGRLRESRLSPLLADSADLAVSILAAEFCEMVDVANVCDVFVEFDTLSEVLDVELSFLGNDFISKFFTGIGVPPPIGPGIEADLLTSPVAFVLEGVR